MWTTIFKDGSNVSDICFYVIVIYDFLLAIMVIGPVFCRFSRIAKY